MFLKSEKVIFAILFFQIIIFTTLSAPTELTNSSLDSTKNVTKRNVRFAYQIINKAQKSGFSDFITPTMLYVSKTIKNAWNSFSNLFSSETISNLNTTKANGEKISSQRSVPQFILENKNKNETENPFLNNSLIRNKRSEQTVLRRHTRAWPAVLPALGKFVGWTAVMTAAGIATAAADNVIKDIIARENEIRLARTSIDCDLNNMGCIQNMCWTNCGPRLHAADWCFVTKNDTKPKPDFVTCKRDIDCADAKCLPCATTCFLEGAKMTENGEFIKN